MASWVTHLRIAEKIKQRINEIDFSYLIMGSIAPDSGVPDESHLNYIPSKETTHFRYMKENRTFDMDETAFFNKYLIPDKFMVRSDRTRAFLWGYYFHLITDRLWSNKYFEPFKTDFLKDSTKTEMDYVKFIRQEMYSLDFQYLKNHGNNLINYLKDSEVNIHFFNEFDVDYIYECKKRIVAFYSEKSFKTNSEYKYLNSEIIDEFVIMTSEKCIGILVD